MMECGLSDPEQDELHTELEKLWVQIRIQVHKIFSEDFSPELLRAAVDLILDQEDLDRRWMDFTQDLVPVWRPSRTLQNHNKLLEQMVRSRLRPEKDQSPDQNPPQDLTTLSSSVKQEVLRLGRVLLRDLLFLSRSVAQSYPDHLDILNHFLKLYHNSFRLRLQELADVSLDSDRAYLLLWTNHSYTQEVLLHPELKDRLKTHDLGPLLSPVVLKKIQDQHQDSTQSRVQRWLNNALLKEEKSWRSGSGSEVIDGFCFSPLALDVIQVIDGALQELKCLRPDQRLDHRPDQRLDQRPDQDQILSELPGFLGRYRCSLEEFLKENLKENQRNTACVVKALLVCEEQLRDLVQSREMNAALRRRCLDALSALRDCGYCSLTSNIQSQLKTLLSGLWTRSWVSGTLPVLDSLLDFLSLELDQMQDLKPSCRKGGACERTAHILDQVSEVLRLQDPDLVQLELVSLVRTCPDLSAAHVSRLLSLKSGQSAASIRQIKRCVEETHPSTPGSTNQSPAFFSRIRVKWIDDKVTTLSDFKR